MRRSALTSLVVVLLLSLAGTSGAGAQSPTPAVAAEAGPVVLGGRIAVPTAGFALTVPDGWYALDLADPDLPTVMASFDAVTALLAPSLDSFRIEAGAPDIAAAYPLVEMPLVALAPLDGPTSGENCNVVVEPSPGGSLDLLVAAQMLTLRAVLDLGDAEPVIMELPGGRAGMLEYATIAPAGGELARTAFFLLRDGRAYTLTCTDAERHADRWLAIAESFVFLTEES